jgi:hypothetical protein
VTTGRLSKGAIYRLKAGIPWQYPAAAVRRVADGASRHPVVGDGTWDRVLAQVAGDADCRG